MPKVLVLFHSQGGNTARLADAVAEGAASVKFTEVELRRIEDLAPDAGDAVRGAGSSESGPSTKYRALESVESLAQYDGIIAGSSLRDGTVSAALKLVLDQAGVLAANVLRDKVGSVFGAAGSGSGGHENMVMSMLVPLMQLGMIIVPPPSGANAIDEADAAALARSQGARVAKVAEWVRHAKSHESHGHRH